MNELCNRYAMAFLELAKEEGNVEKYREEILSIYNALIENKNFTKLLSSKVISRDEKISIIDTVLNKNSESVINYIKVIFDNGRSNYLVKILKETSFKFDSYLNIERGIIYSAIPLKDDEIKKIKKAIEENVNKRCEFQNVIDKSLIGGIKVVLKNDIYDASINTQIEKLRTTLLKKGDISNGN